MDRYKTKRNLVLCGNQEFIIKIDELHNRKLRYTCWKRPKTPMEAPDLILLNGSMRESMEPDKTEFVFPFGEWTYTLEKIETSSTIHIYLETSGINGSNKAWKMNDLTQPRS
ncbi:MAG: hypothetical protein R2819_11095 [Allomuricauda sp.]